MFAPIDAVIFSASIDYGKKYSTFLIWETLKLLKSKNFSSFHLGGGIKLDDGLDNFKRQFGGQKIYNGGLRLICDQKTYENELMKINNSIPKTNFFPPYLVGYA